MQQRWASKFVHFLWSYKPLILLYYSLMSDIMDSFDEFAIQIAKDKMASIGASTLTPEEEWWYGITPNFCEVPYEPPERLFICWNDAKSHYLAIIFYVMYAMSVSYSCYILFRGFYYSPMYGSVSYYAHLVMMKRQKYFKNFLRSLYCVIYATMLLYAAGFFVYWSISEAAPIFLIGKVFATLFIAGIAVSELRTTNEIHFEYNYENIDSENVAPIFLNAKPKKALFGCQALRFSEFVTAEDVFERLEEAVSVYSIVGNDHYLKEILVNGENDIAAIMSYYRMVYSKEIGDSKNGYDLVETNGMATA